MNLISFTSSDTKSFAAYNSDYIAGVLFIHECFTKTPFKLILST